MLQDDNGNTSAMRVGWFLALMIYMISWAATIIKTGSWIPLGMQDAIFMGILMGGKAGQKYLEINGKKTNGNT